MERGVSGYAVWLRGGRRLAVAVVGVCLLVTGFVLMFLPGPGIALVLAGLAVLATEYAWARRWLDAAKRRAHAMRERARTPG